MSYVVEIVFVSEKLGLLFSLNNFDKMAVFGLYILKILRERSFG